MYGWQSAYFYIMPLLALAAVVILIMPAVKLARKIGIIDAPGGRKQHIKAVPPIGGLVIFPISVLIASLSGIKFSEYWPLYLAMALLLVVGAADDKSEVNAWVKFFMQITAAILVVVFGNAQILYLGDFGILDKMLWTGWLAIPFTITAVVLLINAINMIDGLDGLAGGVSAVMLGFFGVAAVLHGDAERALILLIIIGALVGFLIHNMRNPWRRKASVFLGDAGSMCLGLTVAWFAIYAARVPGTSMVPMSVAWVLALPVFDICAQFYRRVREGKHPFDPDRGHFHHHFIEAGLPVKAVTPIIMGVVFMMGLFGWVGIALGIPQLGMAVIWVAALFLHMGISRKPERYVKIISFFCNKNPENIDPEKSDPVSKQKTVTSSDTKQGSKAA
ncbi:MAG: undecaprenyl/decaprenyl-phosphate alpha-N-acetylglucosaminyl 1-phosphate transferase [Alphaproteobacteria bacterium]|nr:undecaprenyl/decaprenyl-phosphate alpha-N-acetylglucosaminyl 1-phosphate transferase [Alphaproteobacteria bacterium]